MPAEGRTGLLQQPLDGPHRQADGRGDLTDYTVRDGDCILGVLIHMLGPIPEPVAA